LHVFARRTPRLAAPPNRDLAEYLEPEVHEPKPSVSTRGHDAMQPSMASELTQRRYSSALEPPTAIPEICVRSANQFRRVPAAASDYRLDRVCSAVGWTDRINPDDDRGSHLRLGGELFRNTVNEHESK
jgi:hypothetical protein